MQSSRRGFFGTVAGALAAGPAIAKDAVERFSNVGGKIGFGSETARGIAEEAVGNFAKKSFGKSAPRPDFYRQAQVMMMRRYGLRPSEMIAAKQSAEMQVRMYGIPPHIQAMRSFSVSAKLRLAQQHYERIYIEQEIRNFFNYETNQSYDTMLSKVARGLVRKFGPKDEAPVALDYPATTKGMVDDMLYSKSADGIRSVERLTGKSGRY